MSQSLVIDIGNKYLKLSVFEIENGQVALLNSTFRDIEGKNNNLISRAIGRCYTDLSSMFNIEQVTVLPKRNGMEHTTLTLEYDTNQKLMKTDLLNQLSSRKSAVNANDLIYDWTIQADCPDEDYQKLFVSGIPVSSFKDTCEILKKAGIKTYSMTTPTANLASLPPKDDRYYFILQIGHLLTSFHIIRNGVTEMFYETTEFGGNTITANLQSKVSLPSNELYTFKNNATYEEITLKDAVDCLTRINQCIKTFYNGWIQSTNQALAGFMIIGGIGNLDLENLPVWQEINCQRLYFRLPIINHKKIDNRLRNYLFESCCAVYPESSEVNFLIPKDKNVGQQVKLIIKIFNIIKYPLWLLIFLALFGKGVNYLSNNYLTTKFSAQQATVSGYQTEVSSLQARVEQLKNEYSELYTDKELSIVNYGKLLNDVGSLVPDNTFIYDVKDVTADYLSNSLDTQANSATPSTPQTTTDTSTDTPTTTTDGSFGNNEADQQLAQLGLGEGEVINNSEVLVVLNISGYSKYRRSVLDYALALNSKYGDAKLITIAKEGEGTDESFNFQIQLTISN